MRGDVRRRPEDPLPCTLEEAVEAYALRHVKLKLCGRVEEHLARLERIVGVLDRLDGYQATLDGNEPYRDAEGVLELWDRVEAAARRVSVAAPAARRPVEIDESDDAMDAFLWARELGYTGVSSKSCRGVDRSLLNRARCARWGPS